MLGSTNDTTTESKDQEESFAPGSNEEFEEFDGGFMCIPFVLVLFLYCMKVL